MSGNHNEIKKSQTKDITNIPKEVTLELSGDEIVKIRFLWIARKPDAELQQRAHDDLVMCFEGCDEVRVVTIQPKSTFSIEAAEGFISAKDIHRIKQEWSKTEQPPLRHLTQYGCVITVNHRFVTPPVTENLEQLEQSLKEITRNKHFKFAVIVW